MSDEQETIPEANAPKPIRIDKRSLFTPSEAVAVEQHSTTPHVSRTRYGTARIEGRLSSPQCESTRSHIATLRRHHSQRPYAQIVRLYHRRCDHP